MKQHISFRYIRPLCLSVAVFLASCGAENLYCDFVARFSSPVSSCAVLYRACTSLGEFCTVTLPTDAQGRILVSSPGQEGCYIQRSQDDINTSNMILGVGGLIIGKPALAEQLSEESAVVCYDLVCPNCYNDSFISKKMTLQTSGTAYCPLCGRTYDLNNSGIVASGESGRQLFRYYCTYLASEQKITVMNG